MKKNSAKVVKKVAPAKARPAAPPARPAPAARPAKVTTSASRGPVLDKPGSSGGTDLAEAAARGARGVSPLKPKDIEAFRDLLLLKRRELLGDVQSMEDEALQGTAGSNLSNLPMHMADMGTDNYEQEFTLGLVEKDRQMLREINIALDKIKKGTFGICEGTGRPISKARLEAKPWARYSLEHTLKVEKGLVRR
ncbi:MAG: TraR/DksA family transcriptional regulator [Tepidisphaerales bacterium]